MAAWGSFFNCYHHHSSFVLRNRDVMANIISSREDKTQGDPLAIVAYMIGFLPLIKVLKSTYPDVTHPCYANDYGALGTSDNLEIHFNLLKLHDTARRYYPEPTKIILIVHLNNPEAGELCG